jgi:hypothetical protein
MLLALALSTFAGIYNVGPKPDALVAACKEVRFVQGKTQNAQMCLSYVAGVVDGQQFMMQEHFPICFPPQVSLEQMVNAVLKYAETHPEVMREKGSAPLVTKAIEDAFPCSAK